jgi:hypothetical protein
MEKTGELTFARRQVGPEEAPDATIKEMIEVDI